VHIQRQAEPHSRYAAAASDFEDDGPGYWSGGPPGYVDGYWSDGPGPGPWYKNRPVIPGTKKYYFSPRELNPESSSPARPSTEWEFEEPDEPMLPLGQNNHEYEWPKDRVPQKLWRGVKLDLRHPELAEVRRALLGPTHFDSREDDGLFPIDPSMVRKLPLDERSGLGEKILDFMENFYGSDSSALGRHWTVSPEVAENYANSNYGFTVFDTAAPSIRVRMRGDWGGQGEDPYRTDTDGDFEEEQEITLLHGAPLTIDQVLVQDPRDYRHDWHNLLDEPQQRTAAFDFEDDIENKGVRPRKASYDPLGEQDWSEIYDELPDTVHRGIGVNLPDDLHRMVHDQSIPPNERAMALLDFLGTPEARKNPWGNDWREGLGTSWSGDEGVAEDYARTSAERFTEHNQGEPNPIWGTDDFGDPLGKPGTAVIFHAERPALEDIADDPNGDGSGQRYTYYGHGEREIPFIGGASVGLRGISWRPVLPVLHPDYATDPEEYTQHWFDEPVYRQAAFDPEFEDHH